MATATAMGMALGFEEGIHNIHDPRLRPMLLQLVMQSHLPEEYHHRVQQHRSHQEGHLIGTGSRLAQLEAAAAVIRRHGLLSEPAVAGMHLFHGAPPAKAGADARKIAVDAWLDRLNGLLSSPVVETRWAGVCLLGISFHEFTRQRFLESYVSWFQKLILQLKPSEPTFVRAAVCASLNDLFARLGGLLDFPGVRREGAALAAKLVQSLSQIFGDNDSSPIWSEALDLLASVLKYFPGCIRQNYSNIEMLLVVQIMDAESNPKLSEKCARCLALLPRAHGEASAWSLMMCRILIAVNMELDKAFAGMEDASTAEEAIATLLPRGQDPTPWPGGVGGAAVASAAQGSKRFWQQLVPRITALLQSCHYLLTTPYPVPVPAPVTPVLALITRILRVDGSRLPSTSPLCASVPTSRQTALCLELPALHLCALNLLNSVICGARSHLLPRAAHIVHLLTDVFRRCGSVPSALRVKLYDISRHLLVSLGAGMAEALGPTVVSNALSDLKGSTSGAAVFSPRGTRTNSVCTWGPGAAQRKRKEPGGVPVDHQGNMLDSGWNVGDLTAPISVQIAALKAIEALLTAGGAMLPERVRAEVDSLVANIAGLASSRSSSGGIVAGEESSGMEGSMLLSSGAFQVAAYKALLASLLSPCSHRPPYLAQGLAIFRNGRKEAGTEVAEVCANALLALEALIHPRCVPPMENAVAASGGRGNAGGGGVPSTLRASKSSSAVGATPAVTATPSNLNFASAMAPSLKVNQLAMDPWAEVDTWLGYGEDLGDDWRGLLAEDISGEGAACAAGSSVYRNEQQNGTLAENQAGKETVTREETDQVKTKHQEVITLCVSSVETSDVEPTPSVAVPVSESMRFPAAPTTTTILSTSGGEFSSSPKREILEVPRPLMNNTSIEPSTFTQQNQQASFEVKEPDTAFAFQADDGMDVSGFGGTAAGSDSDSDVIPEIVVDADPDSD